MADHSDKQTKAQKTQPANPQVESQQEVPASLPADSVRHLTMSTHPPPPTNPAIQRHILQLQRTMGNQATQRLVGSRLSKQMLQRDPAAVFTGIDIKKAVERNHMMSEKLGWTRHLNDIVTYLADQGYFPQGQSPEPSIFAEGIADFQKQRKNLGTPDGIIGGGTWKQMRQEMGIQPTPEEAEWDLTPPWEKTAVPVEKAGRVAQEDSIRESPDILPDNIIGTLKFNTVVFVTKKGGMDNKWYKLTTNDGKEGWYNGDYVALDPPEPTAELYRIQSGDKPINLVGRWYKSGKRFTEWGQDARFYVGALAYANKGRAGMPSPDDLDSLSAWKDVELIAGNHIWQPSKDFLYSLKGKVSSGSISNEIWETAKSVVSTVLNWAICGGAFIAGLIAGPIIWIKDFVVGLVDLAVMIGKVLKSAVNSDLVIDAVDLWDQIKKIDFAELGQHFLDEWNAKSSVGKAFFVGKMVGYIAAEIIFAVLTAGGATAAKWAGKLGSVGRFIASKAPRLAEKVSGVAKALKLSKAEQTAFKTAEKAIEGADDVADAGKLAKGSHIDPEIEDAFKEFDNVVPEGPYETTNKLKRGNFGERAATEWLADEGHKIIDFKPDIRGTNQGGIDMVTLKGGKAYLVDNKALTRSGNVSSVTALTKNFEKNLQAVKDSLRAMLADGSRSASEKAVLRETLDSLESGNYVKAVTNANLTRDSKVLTGVTENLSKQGIEFINVFD